MSNNIDTFAKFYYRLKEYIKAKGLVELNWEKFNKKFSNRSTNIFPYSGIRNNDTRGFAFLISLSSKIGVTIDERCSFELPVGITVFKDKKKDFYCDLYVESGNYYFYLPNDNRPTHFRTFQEKKEVPEEYINFIEDIRYFGRSNAEDFIFKI